MSDEVPSENEETITSTSEKEETITSTSEDEVTVQRSPRYARFMLAGAILCAILALILTYSFPQKAGYDISEVFGYLLIVGIAVGATLGALVAILIDRITTRRARTILADRLDVRVTNGEQAEIDDTSDTHNPTTS